ncbi:MAG: phosphatidylglycerol lysyltransferase domain-containing protein [Desulfocapsaceae bacterium]|nr:phosphatidylglycerol lysyltransferase domain-containing protein [Desulfocapsaceae bacterium]
MITELKPISLDDLELFKDAFASGKQQGWVHFFPFLYFTSRRKSRELLFYKDSGSLCLFLHKKNQQDPSSGRMALYFPPTPMNATALKNSINLINDYNKSNNARIIYVDEHDAHEIAGMPNSQLEIKFRGEEYLYDPKLYREMAGAKFAKMRNDFNHLQRTYSLEIIPYDITYADQCLALLKHWEVTQGAKYDSVSDKIFTRNCLRMADKFEAPDLIGKMILVDNQVKSFGFIGEMYNLISCCFIAKSDHSIPGLNNFMWRQLMLSVESSDLVNGTSDLGHPGLKFAKKMLRPVEMIKIFNARQVRAVTTGVRGGKGVLPATVATDSVSQSLYTAPEAQASRYHYFMNELKILSLADQTIFDQCLMASGNKSWISFFPFLYSFSQRRRRSLYWELYRGSICLYYLLERPSGKRLSLYLPPFPFRGETLAYAMDKVNRCNQSEDGEITWVEEVDSENLVRLGYDIRPVENEYIYAKESLDEFVGTCHFSGNTTIRAFTKEDETACLDLLERWRADYLRKGGKYTGYYFKRSCIQNALKYIDGTLVGKVLLIDGNIQGVCFAGTVNSEYVRFFVTITAPEYRELKLFLQASMTRNFSSPFFNNADEQAGESPPYLAEVVRPVARHRLFRAQQSVRKGT